MNRPFKMIGTITADHLRDLIRASISDMPEWDPSFGLTDRQTAFAHAASPQMVQALLDEIDRLQAKNESLLKFANEMLGVALEGGSLDGADVQDIGVRCGMLTVREVEERCGEVCACAEYGFPAECYRKTSVTQSRDATDLNDTGNLTRQASTENQLGDTP